MKLSENKRIRLPDDNELAQLNQEERRVLGEFYDINSTKQWFRGARIVKNHPETLAKTLEIIADYDPVVEKKEIISFTHKYQLATRWIILGNQ